MVQMYSISALAETQRRVYIYQLKDLRRVSNYKKKKEKALLEDKRVDRVSKSI